MKRRDFALLFVIGLVIPLGIASLQSLPGYLDSDYYFAGGLQLVQGRGFNDPYLWNYLDDPPGIPHPSHTYWLPLSSILSALGMSLVGQQTYAAARMPFILIAACVPPLTAYLAYDISRKRMLALTSGLLAVFSVYHVPFLPVTDNFGVYILLGGFILILVKSERPWAFFAMGFLSGWMNFARSDGLLWLGVLGLLAVYRAVQSEGKSGPVLTRMLSYGLALAVGYLLVMGPWYTRNMAVFGSLMAPGGARVLWLTNYNDTFAFPADQVNFQTWLDQGWFEIIRVRLWALRMNALNALGAQGGILLFPFILLGIWTQRRDVRTRVALGGWLILLVVMTLVFPFAGARGGFFHAGAAFQMLWWALATIGLERLVEAIRKRNWLDDRAYVFFQGMLVTICILLTGVIVWIRILQPGWQPEEHLYQQVEALMLAEGVDPDAIVVVRNPPGYYIVSGRPAIVMPPGGPESVLALAGRYGAEYFILEPAGVLNEYQALYEQYGKYAGFTLLGEVEAVKIYALVPAQ